MKSTTELEQIIEAVRKGGWTADNGPTKQFALDLVNAVEEQNDLNPTLASALVEEATHKLEQLLIKARLDEAKWWNSHIDFVAWEARIKELTKQLGGE